MSKETPNKQTNHYPSMLRSSENWGTGHVKLGLGAILKTMLANLKKQF